MTKCPDCRVKLQKEDVPRRNSSIEEQYFCPECGKTYPIEGNQ